MLRCRRQNDGIKTNKSARNVESHGIVRPDAHESRVFY